jgi:hypothetical protein
MTQGITEPDGDIIDPFGFSIKLTTHDTLLKPCRGCGNVGPRVPYEVVDADGNPTCLLCLKDLNHALFVMLHDYYKRFGYVGFRQKSSSGVVYEGMVGFITPEFQVDEKLNTFFVEISDILCRYRMQLLYHSNIGYKKLEGACFFSLEDRKYWEAVERAIKEYHDAHANEGKRIMYYLIYNQVYFQQAYGISQINLKMPAGEN